MHDNPRATAGRVTISPAKPERDAPIETAMQSGFGCDDGLADEKKNMDTEHQKLNAWIALNVTRTLRRISDAEYAVVCAICEEANKEPHPNLMLTLPYRHEGHCPKYTTDSVAAMVVLEYCMKNLDRLTGRTNFQIVVLYDEGNKAPFCVMTDSRNADDDSIHVENCASAETMELAICRFCKNLHTGKGVAESANAALCDGTVEHQPTTEAKNL